MQTPQTFVAVLDYGKINYTPKTRAAANIAGQILTKRLLATVREDMGAVYSIWASGNMQRVAQDHNAMIQSVFPMKPEMKQQVFDFIAQEFKNMESNITDDELATVIEYMIKNAQEDREKNDAWLNAMTGTLLNGVDTFNGAEATYRSMTVADVQNFMKELNKQGNYKLIYLDAE
jgi:zinc protease